MGIFDFLFKKKLLAHQSEKETNSLESRISKGHFIDSIKVTKYFNIDEYIAFDLETTGLNCNTEKIIEVGFVKFKNGQPIDRYSSLININSHIPKSASKVNHITDDMLSKQGKNPNIVYKEVIEFIGNALNGDTILVAHNAQFDISFLIKTLEEYGYDGKIKYSDTLSMARKIIKGLENYKQHTVAEYFGLSNNEEHRAISDAEICGKIFAKLILMETEQRKKELEEEKITETKYLFDSEEKGIDEIKHPLNSEEKEVCAVIENIFLSSGLDISKIRFYKNSSNYIDVMWVYTILKFKLAKKGKYILLPKERVHDISLEVGECSKSELSCDNIRVYFENTFDLEKISDLLVDIFKKFVERHSAYNDISKYEKEFLKFAGFTCIPENDICGLMQDAKKRQNDKEIEQLEKKRKELEKEELRKQKEERKERVLEIQQSKIAERQKKEEAKVQLQKELLLNFEYRSIESISKIVEFSEQNNKRAVLKLDDNHDILMIYVSVSDASKDVGISPKTIRDVANGRYKHGGGFCWMYADEYLKSESK